MATSSRQIDKVPPAKGNHVEVLVVGLSRTGTMSMYTALTMLDYKCYHMAEACLNADKGHLVFWNEAIGAKYGDTGTGKLSSLAPYSSSDFRKLLQDYKALSDAPTVLFVAELMATYPNARLVLTTHPRGIEGWLRSMRNSYFRILNWGVWDWLLIAYDADFSRPYQSLLRRVVEVWTKEPWATARDFDKVRPQLEKTYGEHVEQVRKLSQVQGRRLLEFDPGQGWGPLCEFLGKDVPSEPYPHTNQGDHVVDLHKRMVYRRLMATFKTPALNTAGGLVLAGITVVALWWFRL